ncbi:unnamed protein product [Adineta ricciae]|uniref:Arrestin C-terminal-like domain-containing protein n=1 Tax=Adineta ricciae TaxID=249248 RepID=A0A814KEG7_ADIRI|nr:unnamed protein product [Adineta ricciae]CAF1101041.1 unnamed protein product [Adineta ricciae]
MGNAQRFHRHQLELHRSDAIYVPSDIISGTVANIINEDLSIVVVGTVRFKKHKKKQIEHCEIDFFSSAFPLIPSSSQTFQIHLTERLPPSFNQSNTFPQISYSLNLVDRASKSRVYSSLPLHIQPRTQIHHPSLLAPLVFGPVTNDGYQTKLQIKTNRSAYQFGDIVCLFYELQNPAGVSIHKIDVSLGIYYLVESNIYQEDITNTTECFNEMLSTQKLFRNKAILHIPEDVYLPPTFKYKHDQGDERAQFHLTIEYKVQFKVYLGNSDDLWQVDIPVALCHEILEQAKTELC